MLCGLTGNLKVPGSPHGLLVMDATGAGDPINEDLARVWPRIKAVNFTNQKKVELSQRVVVAIEQR